ncbi:sulfotransferase [Croceicoccus sp. F390]|uniref:Sulfotransferase n=1 Tax=Croceicoccus esteveae TaxID=3075597 RepID=A0ABU2ZFK5_9SPHN|nr:sulfotransferase [Croceicoccus sp. F390]MDT0575368.1 sulfotransferase [Croceicoccus sp. F390]
MEAKVASHVPDCDVLEQHAMDETGLQDFGDRWIFENLAALIPALNEEAGLTEAGAAGARQMIVSALSNRLRHVELVKQHPEILQEKIEVAAVVVGLPRTGSTMLHRMLASAPGMTGVRWWECQNYAPFVGDDPHDPEPRRAAASQYLDYFLEHAPDIMSIHPMNIDQPDEELIILGQLFSSTMIEGMYYVPSYARWLMEHSRTRCYTDLKEILQSLQWQDKRRNGAKWVLKTPGHLMALDAVLEVFPEARIVMTHRDPVQTVPSYASMEATLYAMAADIDKKKIAAFWQDRLAELLTRFMDTREASGGRNFIDVQYRDLTSNPIEEGQRVLREAGIVVTPTVVSGMEEWIEANRREDRAAHNYSLEEYGLSSKGIEQRFARYREDYLNS